MAERDLPKVETRVRFPLPAQIFLQNLSEARPSFAGRPARKMYQVYILQSLKDKRTYVGYTQNLDERLKEHNTGQNISTKHRAPFRIIHSEEFSTIKEAKQRELYWKSGGGRRKLKEFFN